MNKLMWFLVVMLMTAGVLMASDFKVTNGTKVGIKHLLASEKGSGKWGQFNLGGVLAPGKSVQLEWDESTDDTDCNWQIKAVFTDGSESDPAMFNFCEEDLEIEFE